MTEERVSRGLASGISTMTAELDVVINDLDGSPQVLRNEITPIGNWLKVRLKGPRREFRCDRRHCRRSRTGTPVQRRLVQSGSSYISQEDKRVQFGLGKAGQADSVQVRGPMARLSAAEREGESDHRDPAERRPSVT